MSSSIHYQSEFEKNRVSSDLSPCDPQSRYEDENAEDWGRDLRRTRNRFRVPDQRELNSKSQTFRVDPTSKFRRKTLLLKDFLKPAGLEKESGDKSN